MRNFIKVVTSFFLLLTFPHVLSGQDSLMLLLDKELVSLQHRYSNKDQPPYFMDMHVHEIRSIILRYSYGSLVSDDHTHSRILSAGMRIGSYETDNTSVLPDEQVRAVFSPVYTVALPVEDDSLAICFTIENCMENAYEQSLQQYRAVINKDRQSDKEDNIHSFSIEKPSVYYEEPEPLQIINKELGVWKDVLKEISEQISSDTDIITSVINLMILDEKIYYLNSEGTRNIQSRPQCQLQMHAVIKTSDGYTAPLIKSYIGRKIKSIPSPDDLLENTLQFKQLLKDLKSAPLAQPYTGPAILSPEAAGVFFHEIFGHRIEGQRLNYSFDSQTFKDRINKKVINENITIISDPSLKSFNGIPLFGSYAYDDEGVPSRPVTVVEKGILKEFLMSRVPVKGQSQSNGHGRAQVGYAPFSRQSNMIIRSSKSVTESSMRKLLIKECRKQGKQYGYFIKEVFGGFTTTDLFSPQVFNIFPTVVYRIYVDGRPDELVRGVSFIGTPLTVFSEIIATSDQSEVFNGFCGAESGNIPVSTISPGMLIKKIETQKIPESKIAMPQIQSPVQIKRLYKNPLP
jgi:TldD protein